jgi:hypothetical protein
VNKTLTDNQTPSVSEILHSSQRDKFELITNPTCDLAPVLEDLNERGILTDISCQTLHDIVNFSKSTNEEGLKQELASIKGSSKPSSVS